VKIYSIFISNVATKKVDRLFTIYYPFYTKGGSGEGFILEILKKGLSHR